MKSIAKLLICSIAFLGLVSVLNASKYEEGVKFLSDSLKSPYEDYDFYVFTVSWSDSFCKTLQKPADCYSRIQALHDHRILRIHGLWPSRKDGVFLKSCNDSGHYVTIPDSDEEPFITMSQIWPSLNSNGEKHFWEHEFNKHGYCYTKRNDIATYQPYFEKAVEMYNQLGVKDAMNNAFHGQPGDRFSVTYTQLESKLSEELGGVFYEFDCRFKNGEQLLNEVRMYLDLDFKRMTGFKQHTNCHKDQDIVFYMENDN